MEELTWKEKLTRLWGKYRYVLLVLAVGLFLMALPEGTGEEERISTPVTQSAVPMEEQLEDILGKIQGVGKVAVLLTEAAGAETIYRTDQDQTDTSLREETVLVTGSDRAETGLVLQTLPPIYRGAVIVCQGADQPSVRLAVVEAVSNATAISTDRITVVKMK